MGVAAEITASDPTSFTYPASVSLPLSSVVLTLILGVVSHLLISEVAPLPIGLDNAFLTRGSLPSVAGALVALPRSLFVGVTLYTTVLPSLSIVSASSCSILALLSTAASLMSLFSTYHIDSSEGFDSRVVLFAVVAI